MSAGDVGGASGYGDGGRLARSYAVRGCTVVELSGDVDLATVGEIRVVLDEATAPSGPPHVVVDLSRTTFFDCTGLDLLVRAEARMARRAGRLGLVCVQQITLRMMEIANLTGLLRPVPTLEQALERPG
ncbi:anti-sigma factor antagonist [Streptomyces sp. 796.1]|uniref:anti-sigma factor antagonist n=1 Tax=Streptomyces sp. 796.1 TaxID=3163029 RepID=UPI0039C9FA56